MSIYDIFILLGGVGLFLYGMTIMSSGLKNACGDNLKVILGKATKNKVTSILAGIAVTIFVQSSSATDVMVIGFVIGTGLSIWKAHRTGVSSVPSNLAGTISQTSTALQILWNAKVFLLSVGLTAWLSVSRWGRQMLLANFREHTLLACCAMFSYCTLPFAPLGLENAVAGVCFFCMFWVLILVKSLTDKFYYRRKQL